MRALLMLILYIHLCDKKIPETNMKSLLISLVFVLNVFSQTTKWKNHDFNRPQPPVVIPGENCQIAPSDAVKLFNGNGMDAWEGRDGKPLKWQDKGAYFECVAGAGYIQTKEKFGDVQLHIEWASPSVVKGKSQGRGNSGVFLMGEYEVQVLDSYQNPTYPDGQAAAIYGQAPPLVNASRGPGEWQIYDIIFRRPRFDNNGDVLKPAILTVFHNGVLVQDHFELIGGTEWLIYDAYKPHEDRLPLSLQDHDNPVRFRNIWIRDIEPEKEKSPVYPEPIVIPVSDLQKYIGEYEAEDGEKFKIYIKNNTLFLNRSGRQLELLFYSKNELSAKDTAIDLNFEFSSNGDIVKMIFFFEDYKKMCKPIK